MHLLRREGQNHSKVIIFTAERVLNSTASLAWYPTNVKMFLYRYNMALVDTHIPFYWQLWLIPAAVMGGAGVCNACTVGFKGCTDVDAFFPLLGESTKT